MKNHDIEKRTPLGSARLEMDRLSLPGSNKANGALQNETKHLVLPLRAGEAAGCHRQATSYKTMCGLWRHWAPARPGEGLSTEPPGEQHRPDPLSHSLWDGSSCLTPPFTLPLGGKLTDQPAESHPLHHDCSPLDALSSCKLNPHSDAMLPFPTDPTKSETPSTGEHSQFASWRADYTELF